MRRRRSRFVEGAIALATIAAAGDARAQACCAGSSAVTPARLALHEDALVGGTLRGGLVLGSYGDDGAFASPSPGASEIDLEQDLFGAVRVLRQGQLALLVPVVETHRVTRTLTETGGGIGDVNASARWDFTVAGESRVVPGIAALAGVTLPTGRAPEDASKPLATDATGVGALQANGGIAVEQSWGAWTAMLTGLVAKRAARDANGIHTLLATQWTLLAAGSYAFPNDAALALVASFTAEGNATENGVERAGSGRRATRLTAAGLYPLSDKWKLLATLYTDPPIGGLGRNQPADAGLSFTAVRAW